jgi:hypothetical protein
MLLREESVYGCCTACREKNPFNDKQSQIAERQTVGEQGPGDQQPGRGRRRAGGMRRGAGMQREEEREVNQK